MVGGLSSPAPPGLTPMSQPSTLTDAPPTSAEVAADDPLRAFLSGKRLSERHACHVPAVLEGALAPVAATLLDVSHGGALVQIDEPAFLEAESGAGVQAYLDLLSHHASRGLRLAFPGHAFAVGASVVRWTPGSGPDDVSRVGLRFDRVLGDEELTALRTGTPAATPAEAHVAEEAAPRLLPYAPRRGAVLQALVFRALRPEAGPVIAGATLGVGPEALALRVPGRRPLIEIAGLLAGHNLLLTLQERGVVLWESIAHVAWVAPVADGSAVDVGLAADTPHSKAVLKRFQRV